MTDPDSRSLSIQSALNLSCMSFLYQLILQTDNVEGALKICHPDSKLHIYDRNKGWLVVTSAIFALFCLHQRSKLATRCIVIYKTLIISLLTLSPSSSDNLQQVRRWPSTSPLTAVCPQVSTGMNRMTDF